MGFVAPMIVGFIINDHNDVEHWKVRLLWGENNLGMF